MAIIIFFQYTVDVNYVVNSIRGRDIDLNQHVYNQEKLTEVNDKASITSAFKEKVEMESFLNSEAAKRIAVYSHEKRYSLLLGKKFDLPEDLLLRVKKGEATYEDEKLIQLLLAASATDEENFWLEMKDQKSFHDLKKIVDMRYKNTGTFYGNELLKEGVTYRDASVDEIVSILDDGAQLPENALFQMVAMKNVDLAVDLHKKGIALNADYVDPLSTQSSIEYLIELYSISPYESVKLIDDVKKLIEIGVPLNMKDGTRDVLDIMLERAVIHDENMSEQILNSAVELNNVGIFLENSHLELLDNLRYTHPNLYEKYVHHLK